jgi:hypothetical protein
VNRPLVCIGYDSREDLAYRVCRASLLEHCPWVDVVPLKLDNLRLVHARAAFLKGEQAYDSLDLKPFSTEFSFSRFITPLLARWTDREKALFVDSDFLFRADVSELLNMELEHSVYVVQHDYRPTVGTKMRGQVAQQGYNRKLWSALMLFNVPRVSLTPYSLNILPGSYLHQFEWVSGDIGRLPESWHWVPGHSPIGLEPRAVHFTEGTPDVPGYEDQPYADEWLEYANRVSRHSEVRQSWHLPAGTRPRRRITR